jgi:phosphatidylglycerophosphate synthase
MAAGVLDSFMQAPPDERMLRPPLSDTVLSQQTSGDAVLRAFVLTGAGIAALMAGMATVLLPEVRAMAAVVVLAMMAAVLALGARGLRQGHPYTWLGAANQVTLLRAGIMALTGATLCLPGGLAERPMLAWAMVCLVTFGLALDGVDGWLARRTGLVSAFGARFDMEVDAALAAILCLLAILSGKAGLWLMPLGFLRYAWVLAGLALPWLTGPLPERLSRKTICVVQIAVLAALLAPIITPPVSVMLALGALLALVWSFGRDALLLWRAR